VDLNKDSVVQLVVLVVLVDQEDVVVAVVDAVVEVVVEAIRKETRRNGFR
jgi:hypothetical protein